MHSAFMERKYYSSYYDNQNGLSILVNKNLKSSHKIVINFQNSKFKSLYDINDLLVLNRGINQNNETIIDAILDYNIDLVITFSDDDNKVNLKSFKSISNYSETIMDQETPTVTKKNCKFKIQNSTEENKFTQMDIASFDIDNPNTFASILKLSIGDNNIANERILIIFSRYIKYCIKGITSIFH